MPSLNHARGMQAVRLLLLKHVRALDMLLQILLRRFLADQWL